MQYRLKTDKRIRAAINRLPGHVRQPIKRILNDLRTNPRPTISEEMRDDLAGHYRIKFGEWRIVYWIDDEVLLIELLKVGKKHGSEFYEDIR